MKKFLISAALGILLAAATPASAQIHVGLHINVGPPPPPREEVVPRPRGNVVWIEGYYKWHPRRHRYTWVRGHWERPPHPHSVWVAGRWEHRNGEWVYFEGRWETERVRRH
ncbi:MAG TPA: hypothetical protein VMM58_08810 [Bacteroidota bacterium]|nr:hypothetical protein [Bacteroidota bacterium]